MRDIKVLNITAPPSTTGIPHNLQTHVDNNAIEVFPTKDDFKDGTNKRWTSSLWRIKSKKSSKESPSKVDNTPKPSGLHLSEPQHIERIEMDMRHLAVTIGSSIDTAAQWKLFCENGGSILPLLQCIMDGASAVVQGVTEDSSNEPAASFVSERHHVLLTTASSACKALRDLSTISKAMSVVLTDEILRYDAAWSKTTWVKRKGDEACRTGGIISAMLILLNYSMEAEIPTDPRNLSTNGRVFGSRRKRKGKYLFPT